MADRQRGAWRKVVVLLLGFALVASFGLGAVASQWGRDDATAEAQALLQAYDEQAVQWWDTGRCDWPALEDSLGPIRASMLDQGLAPSGARSASTATSATRSGDDLLVEAEVHTELTLSADGMPTTTSGSTDRHRMVFSGDGTLVEDELLGG